MANGKVAEVDCRDNFASGYALCGYVYLDGVRTKARWNEYSGMHQDQRPQLTLVEWLRQDAPVERGPSPEWPNHEYDFGWALQRMRAGYSVRRKAWQDTGRHLTIHFPGPNDKMQRPYLYIRTCKGQLVPWAPTHTDVLAQDWGVFRKEE